MKTKEQFLVSYRKKSNYGQKQNAWSKPVEVEAMSYFEANILVAKRKNLDLNLYEMHATIKGET